MIIQRYNTFQQYWQRICREIENGTYKRDLGRAAERFGAAADHHGDRPAPAEDVRARYGKARRARSTPGRACCGRARGTRFDRSGCRRSRLLAARPRGPRPRLPARRPQRRGAGPSVPPPQVPPRPEPRPPSVAHAPLDLELGDDGAHAGVPAQGATAAPKPVAPPRVAQAAPPRPPPPPVPRQRPPLPSVSDASALRLDKPRHRAQVRPLCRRGPHLPAFAVAS